MGGDDAKAERSLVSSDGLGEDSVTPLERIAQGPSRDAVSRMRRICPEADPARWLPGVPPERVPRHIGIIMDGNGRWAERRGFPRVFGHRNGARAVRATIEAAGRFGVEALTLYAFSNENWRRPSEEVSALMSMYVEYMAGEREALVRQNLRFRQIGRREGLPDEALAALDSVVEATRGCTGATLCLAVNYGGRQELVDAARSIGERIERGEMRAGDIDEALISETLGTSGLPDPDLIIRTAGEKRLSNFLLWQASYAELVVLDACWPDFDEASLRACIEEYAGRERRFGGVRSGSVAGQNA
ncbi:MAG: isoprenyl transferase [Phycisphaerales bacterium]